MALKPPPPPWEVLQQLGDMVGGGTVRGEVDKSVRALAQSALSRLDLVNREEFDAQAEILARTRARVLELEAVLEEMGRELEALSEEKLEAINTKFADIVVSGEFECCGALPEEAEAEGPAPGCRVKGRSATKFGSRSRASNSCGVWRGLLMRASMAARKLR